MEAKKRLRREQIAARRELAADNRQAQEAALCARLCSSAMVSGATAILGYWPKAEELSLVGLYNSLLDEGKALYFPRVEGEAMAFYHVRDFGELALGAFNVMEPVAGCSLWQSEGSGLGASLCLVPGVTFDEACNRMGYGKGYYDRFLEEHPQVFAVGVGYTEQVLPELFTEPHDVPLDAVVTAAEFYGDFI